jgi:sugar lactone lactonase YvrE
VADGSRPTASHHGDRQVFPDRIELPDNFQPEGITVGPRQQAYLGSRLDGDILRADLRTGRTTTISQGPGSASVGLKIDQRGRLFVAGGPAGTLRVVDARTGTLLRTYQLATGESFMNDVLIAGDTVWVTDSRRATLFRLDLGRRGELPRRATAVSLTGDWVQAPSGTNAANGISDTPDRSALLVVNSFDGGLYRVDPRSGAARKVDLGGTVLTNGDGLLRDGRTLYAVQNRLNQVAVVQLSKDGRSGRLQRTITDDDFDVPTTVARLGRSLYLPNARFSTTPTPTTEYWITRVAAPGLR